MKTVFIKRIVQTVAGKLVPNFVFPTRGLFRAKGWLQQNILQEEKQEEDSVKLTNMRTLRFRSSFPSCINRKVSDERPKNKALEMGDFPLHILESRRKERLAELKAECLELKHQLSEHSLQTALLKEAQLDESSVCSSNDKGPLVLSGRHSKSMHELRRAPPGNKAAAASTLTIFSEEALRRRREERLKIIRRELEDFAIKYSIGEYAEKIEGIEKSPIKKSKSANLETMNDPPSSIDLMRCQILHPGPLAGVDTVNAAILLRIQRQREQELQRARLELKHLAFRLKHKLDEESGTPNKGTSTTT